MNLNDKSTLIGKVAASALASSDFEVLLVKYCRKVLDAPGRQSEAKPDVNQLEATGLDYNAGVYATGDPIIVDGDVSRPTALWTAPIDELPDTFAIRSPSGYFLYYDSKYAIAQSRAWNCSGRRLWR